VKCAAQSFEKNQYPVLAAYIGNRFGGSGNTFNLPNLSGAAPATGLNYLITVTGNDPNSPGARYTLLGALILLPFNETFKGLLLCNGALLPAAQNTALYSLIGTKFGGNTQQFAWPNLTAAVPTNYNYHMAQFGVYPTRP
jgi:microcystin-dependent protein